MKTVLKLFACWAAFAASLIASGILAKAFALRVASADLTRRLPYHLILVLAAGASLTLGVYFIARGLAGSAVVRAAALALFLALALGVNTILDGVIYTDLFDGLVPATVLLYSVVALFLGTALGFFFGMKTPPTGFGRFAPLGWIGRVLVAWLAWPVVYLFFGACVAPIVVPFYRAGGVPGLHIPPMGTIMGVQLVRSLLFLVASLPLIKLWTGSRRGLWLALGLAHTFAVGIYGLVAAAFLPAVMRVAHGTEITCDSFAYAGLLVILFAAKGIHVEKQASNQSAAA